MEDDDLETGGAQGGAAGGGDDDAGGEGGGQGGGAAGGAQGGAAGGGAGAGAGAGGGRPAAGGEAYVQLTQKQYDQIRAAVERIPKMQQSLAQFTRGQQRGGGQPQGGRQPQPTADKAFWQEFLENPEAAQRKFFDQWMDERYGEKLSRIDQQHFDAGVRTAAGDDYEALQPHIVALMNQLADQAEAGDKRSIRLAQIAEEFPDLLVNQARAIAGLQVTGRAAKGEEQRAAAARGAAGSPAPGARSRGGQVTPEQLKGMSLEDMEKLGGVFADPE